MKVLIVGAAGMIGSKLSKRLARDGRLADRPIGDLHLVDIVAPQPPENPPFRVAVAASDMAAPGHVARAPPRPTFLSRANAAPRAPAAARTPLTRRTTTSW